MNLSPGRSGPAIHRLFVIVLLLWLLPLAHAEVPVQKAIYTDPTRQLGIDDTPAMAFKPFDGPVSRGYTPAVSWVRLDVPPSDAPELALRIQPNYLDDVRLYSPGPGGGWRVQQIGDTFPYSARVHPEVSLTLTLVPDRAETTRHFLRVETTSAHIISAHVTTPAENRRFNDLFHVLIGLYEGVVLLLGWSALTHWWGTRDRLWLWSAAFQFSTIGATVFTLGFASAYLVPDHPEIANAGVGLLTCLQVFLVSVFFWRLLGAYGARWVLPLVYLVSMALFPVFLVLFAIGQPRAAVSMNANLLLLQSAWGAATIWFLKVDDRFLRWLIRLPHFALSLYVLYFILPFLGLAPTTELVLYPALAANLLTALMQHAVMLRRDWLRTREQERLEREVQVVNQQLVWEMDKRAEAASFMGMLMHELKTPLASIRLATQSLLNHRTDGEGEQAARYRNIQKSIEGIDAVLERCIETDRLEQGALVVKAAEHDVAALVGDWLAGQPHSSRVDADLPPRLLARIDAPLLCLMLRNLLDNALAYSPPETRVSLVLKAEAAGLRLVVRNAIGRAGAPDAARVFEKYYRAPAAHRFTGTGLGLYWVHSVSRLMGGQVVYRQDGDDVEFALELPC